MNPEDAEEEMARRITKAGYTWKGAYPRTKEIVRAGEEYKRQKEVGWLRKPSYNAHWFAFVFVPT